jgi:hypothetical protein
MTRTIAAALALAFHIFAADVTGSWETTWKDRDGRTGTTVFKFTADGNKLTGTITTGPSEQWPITDGVVNGDEISFTVVFASEGENGRAMYTGKVEESRIVFVIRSERDKEGHKFTARRTKDAGGT